MRSIVHATESALKSEEFLDRVEHENFYLWCCKDKEVSKIGSKLYKILKKIKIFYLMHYGRGHLMPGLFTDVLQKKWEIRMIITVTVILID